MKLLVPQHIALNYICKQSFVHANCKRRFRSKFTATTNKKAFPVLKSGDKQSLASREGADHRGWRSVGFSMLDIAPAGELSASGAVTMLADMCQ